MAVVGVGVALVAGGTNILGGNGDDKPAVSGAKNVGKGRQVDIGYIPWDEGIVLGAWGKGDGIHTLARDGFAAKELAVARWLKDFTLSEKELTGLEAAVHGAGQGHEQDGVRDWLARNPSAENRLAPVGSR